jgi:hypothetical protein
MSKTVLQIGRMIQVSQSMNLTLPSYTILHQAVIRLKSRAAAVSIGRNFDRMGLKGPIKESRDAMPRHTLTSIDLVRLAEQIDRDKAADWRDLQDRDYAIGRECPKNGPVARLLYWLGQNEEAEGAEVPSPWLSEGALGLLIGGALFLTGFLAMTGFLFAHTSGLVNVLWFILLFVLLQFALCLVSAATLFLAVFGRREAGFTFNPARLVFSRTIRQRRYWREFRSVFSLIFLRYGQGMGIGFMTGAMTAFLLVLAVNDFSFVWSSTFNLSNAAVERFTATASAPWSGWLPVATVDAQVIAESRYHPAAAKFSAREVRSMHSWWPFLFACMTCYALLPRVLLWLASRLLYRSRLRRAFVGYPGADLVLRRMNRPAVTTQAEHDSAERAVAVRGDVAPRTDELLISWSGAIGADETGEYQELAGIPADRVMTAGLSLDGDRDVLAVAAGPAVNHAVVVAKAWEPPLSELADFLEQLRSCVSSELFVRPLAGAGVTESSLEDWQQFATTQPGGAIALAALTRWNGGADAEDDDESA